jgi:drug/metabolite transporter (DMT)-like permease
VALVDGFVFSSGAALSLGAGDVLAGLVARRVGTIRTVTGSLLISLAALWTYIAVVGLAFPKDPSWFTLVAALGVLRAIGYLALVQAFRLGPLSLVSAISACSAATKVLLAVVLLGEQPDTLQWAAVPIATVGSVLALLQGRSGPGQSQGSSVGIALAVVALVSLGLVTVGLKGPIAEGGWAQTVTVRRSIEVVVTLLFFVPTLVAVRKPPRADAVSAPGIRPRRLALALSCVAMFDTIGLSSLAVALSVAPAWLVGLVSSSSPVVALTVGTVAFQERLRPRQWAGIGLVAASIVLATVG